MDGWMDGHGAIYSSQLSEDYIVRVECYIGAGGVVGVVCVCMENCCVIVCACSITGDGMGDVVIL